MKGLTTNTGKVRYPLHHVITNGQSLSVGYPQTAIAEDDADVYQLFDSSGTYDTTNPSAGTLSAIQAHAPIRTVNLSGLPYPANLMGNAPDVAFAKQLATLKRAAGAVSYPIGISNTGQGGQAMAVIKKGGTGNAYAAGIYEATALKRLFTAGYVAECILFVHGEADAQFFNASYASQLVQMQSDYQGDLATIAGVSRTVPMLMSQQHGYPSTFGGINMSAAAMLAVAMAHPTTHVLVGPKYQYPYNPADFLHLTEYRGVGEMAARVLDVFQRTGSWSPVWPTSIVRSGTTVTVNLNVPSGSLVLDTSGSIVALPHQTGTPFAPFWSGAGGFEAYDQALTIASCTNTTPIHMGYTTPHGRSNGDWFCQGGISGNNAANGVFKVQVVDSTHLDLYAADGVTPIAGTGAATFSALSEAFVPIQITSATISGNSVVLTLARTPTNLFVGYAEHGDRAYGGTGGGSPAGRCGILRTSIPFIGVSGIVNYDWGVEFTQAVA